MADRSWTITIIAPTEWLTANIERNRFQRAEKVKAWRTQTVAACQAAALPKGVTPVRLTAVVEYASRQAPVRDRLNLAPTIKAIVDGLSPARTWTRACRQHHTPGYGLLPDDSDKHVLSTEWTLARQVALWPPLGRVVLTITEVTS